MQKCDNKEELQHYGIQSEYLDAWGTPKTVNESSLTALLQTLSTSQECAKDMPLKPVYVWKETQKKLLILTFNEKCFGQEPCFEQESSNTLNTASHILKSTIWQLENEYGELQQGTLASLLCSCDLEPNECNQVFADTFAINSSVEIHLPMPLPTGYYKFTLSIPNQTTPCLSRFIITPERCYQPEKATSEDNEQRQRDKLWGASIQLYTLKSETNWGIGDFGDLKLLASNLALRGADFIGLNPLHALFPEKSHEPSPYSPSSRYWLNFIYLDVPHVDGFDCSSNAQNLVNSEQFQHELAQLREASNVQYTKVMDQKLAILKAIHRDLVNADKDNTTAHAYLTLFSDFKAHHGDALLLHGCFDAIHDKTAEHPPLSAKLAKELNSFDPMNWDAFIKQYPSPQSRNLKKFIKLNPELVDFYCFVQWQAHKQLHDVYLYTNKLGMKIGLYRDLAVGVNSQSSDVWVNESLFSKDASIGAPPDVLNYQGQNWGLPPMNPQALKVERYQAMIELLQSNMASCGALRIDHILGLMRLWWVPQNAAATDGAYIHYPVDDFLGILALESQRHRCLIIGEDLGTIPEEIKAKLSDTGVLSYKVFFFNTAPDGGFYSPNDYPAQSLSTLCTHDMPTLRGYWHTHDLDLSQALHLIPEGDLIHQLHQERLESKQRILDSMNWHGSLPKNVQPDALNVAMDTAFNRAIQLHMARTQSDLLSLQLEDWLEMDNPVNVPGTSTEYPNWQRKLSQTLEAMFDNPELDQFLRKITQIRHSL